MPAPKDRKRSTPRGRRPVARVRGEAPETIQATWAVDAGGGDSPDNRHAAKRWRIDGRKQGRNQNAVAKLNDARSEGQLGRQEGATAEKAVPSPLLSHQSSALPPATVERALDTLLGWRRRRSGRTFSNGSQPTSCIGHFR